MQIKDVPLRTRGALLLYKVYGDSTLLVLNGTSLTCMHVLVTIQIFKLCACPLDPLNPHSSIQHNMMESGIGIELLDSLPQTRLS